jgi:hypothetical protein
MTELQFNNVEGWKTHVDSFGHLEHEKLGVSNLIFSDSQLQFSDLLIPYNTAEDPKLHVDKMLFKNWIRFDIISQDIQYTFVLRTKLKTLQEIPLPFKISVNRRILINFVMVLMSMQLFIGIFGAIYKWLLK